MNTRSNTHARAHANTYTRTHIYTHTHIQAHTHAHTHALKREGIQRLPLSLFLSISFLALAFFRFPYMMFPISSLYDKPHKKTFQDYGSKAVDLFFKKWPVSTQTNVAKS